MENRKIRVAIVGFGNIGRGVLQGISAFPDMKLAGIFTRRVNDVRQEVAGSNIPVFPMDEDTLAKQAGNVDVFILCGGSTTDLRTQSPLCAKYGSILDSYDDHPIISDHFEEMDKVAIKAGTIALVCVGWDPGIYSVMRVIMEAFLPGVKVYPFYGLTKRGGVSQGHSNDCRGVPGVVDARQYTHAKLSAIKLVRSGANPDLKPGERQWRECFVVLENDTLSERKRVGKAIRTMPVRFAPYRTVVRFITQLEMDEQHSDMPHDGVVIACGETSPGQQAIMEFSCRWESNPEATARIMLAHARAVAEMKANGMSGAFTPLDIMPACLSSHSREILLQLFM